MFYGEHNRCISHLSGPFTLAVLLDVEIQSSPDRKRSPRRTNKFPLIRKERNKIIFRISMLEGKLSCLHKHSIFLNCFLFWNKVLGGIGPLALCLPIYEMREGPPNVTHWRRAAYTMFTVACCSGSLRGWQIGSRGAVGLVMTSGLETGEPVLGNHHTACHAGLILLPHKRDDIFVRARHVQMTIARDSLSG